MRNALRRFVPVVFAIALTACGSDSTTGPTASIVGTWHLQSINGTPLPYVIAQTGTNKTELTADVFTVSVGGSFTETTTLRLTVNGQVTTQSGADAGNYTLNGTAVSFRFNSDGSTGTGAWSGNTVTVAESGFSYIYTR